jgi:hypothetical protein
MHTYQRRDVEALLKAKHLNYQITSIGGINRLVVPFSPKSQIIKDWDELYATISAIPSEPDPLVPEGVKVQDPATMKDEDFVQKETPDGPKTPLLVQAASEIPNRKIE